MDDIPKASQVFTINELWAKLQESGELVLLIDAEDEVRIRKALSKKKGKQHEKIKAAGLPTPTETLEYFTTPAQEPNKVYLRCTLRELDVVRVFELVIPSNDIGV